MTCKKYLIILFLLCSQFCFAQNLIQNGSFEDSSGFPSLNGWFIGNASYDGGGYLYDTNTIKFSSDTPPGGENWSVMLAVDNDSSKRYVMWMITGVQGTYIYDFSVWARKWSHCVGATFPWTPSLVAIGLLDSIPWKSNTLPLQPSLSQGKIFDFGFSDSLFQSYNNYTNWTKIILIDTITSAITDTIAVVLAVGDAPWACDTVYYDLAEFKIIDTLTSTYNTMNFPPQEIKIYPNPFNEKTSIKFINKKHDSIQLTVFTLTGGAVSQIETSGDYIFIERGKLSAGMYFFQLMNINKGEFIGHGKLVLQ